MSELSPAQSIFPDNMYQPFGSASIAKDSAEHVEILVADDAAVYGSNFNVGLFEGTVCHLLTKSHEDSGANALLL